MQVIASGLEAQVANFLQGVGLEALGFLTSTDAEMGVDPVFAKQPSERQGMFEAIGLEKKVASYGRLDAGN